MKTIRTDTEYKEALLAASSFFDNPPVQGTPEGHQFEILISLINAYEEKRHPIVKSSPIEAVEIKRNKPI